jgi:hypothetical protein
MFRPGSGNHQVSFLPRYNEYPQGVFCPHDDERILGKHGPINVSFSKYNPLEMRKVAKEKTAIFCVCNLLSKQLSVTPVVSANCKHFPVESLTLYFYLVPPTKQNVPQLIDRMYVQGPMLLN